MCGRMTIDKLISLLVLNDTGHVLRSKNAKFNDNEGKISLHKLEQNKNGLFGTDYL